jgi:hypothetical protein
MAYEYGSLPSSDKRVKISYSLTPPKGNTPGSFAGKIEVERDILYSDLASATEAMNTEYGTQGYFLLEQTIEQDGPMAKQKLTYVLRSGEGDDETTFLDVPDDTYVEECGVEQVDIRLHPKFETEMREAWQWNAELERFKLEGKEQITHYLAPTFHVTVTEFATSKLSLDFDELGKRGTAPGGQSEYESGDNWLLVDLSRGKSGSFWTRTKIYQRSEVTWDETIYGAA